MQCERVGGPQGLAQVSKKTYSHCSSSRSNKTNVSSRDAPPATHTFVYVYICICIHFLYFPLRSNKNVSSVCVWRRIHACEQCMEEDTCM